MFVAQYYGKKDFEGLRVCGKMYGGQHSGCSFQYCAECGFYLWILWIPKDGDCGGGGFTMYSVILGHLGSDAVAANSIANITKNLLICVCTGFGYGGSIIIGNLLGKGNLSETQKNGNILCRIAVFSGRGRYKIRIEVRCGYHVVFCGSIGISGGICMEAAGADGIFCIKS
mgnify:FL=1